MRDAISGIGILLVLAMFYYGTTACKTWIEDYNQQVQDHNQRVQEWNEQIGKRNQAIEEWNQAVEDGDVDYEARQKLNRALAEWNLFLAENHRQRAEDLMPEIKQEEKEDNQ